MEAKPGMTWDGQAIEGDQENDGCWDDASKMKGAGLAMPETRLGGGEIGYGIQGLGLLPSSPVQTIIPKPPGSAECQHFTSF